MLQRQQRIFIAVIMTLAVFAAELAGGLIFGSVSLVADSFHVIMDVIALLTSYLALRAVLKPNWRADYSFGYHQLEVLAALFNGGTLSVTIFLIIEESIDRFFHPVPMEASMVLIIAAIGLVANLASAKFLGDQNHKHSSNHNHGIISINHQTDCPEADSRNHGVDSNGKNHVCIEGLKSCPTEACANEDLNIKSAYLHVVGDALSSVIVIIGAIIIATTNITWIDPLLALIIAAILFKGTYNVLKESLSALMSKSPVDIQKVQTFLEGVPKVKNVHDLHVWRLCSQVAMLSAHVKVSVQDLSDAEKLMESIEEELREHFNIQHVTIQLETPDTPVQACKICHD